MVTSSTLAAPAERPGSLPEEVLLELSGIGKDFPGLTALEGTGLRLRPGTVHAVVGENGAGKSTLMKIVAGVLEPDRGEIRLRGEKRHLRSPLEALEQGVAMIHQDFALMGWLTVAETIWIRREPRNRLGLIDHGKMRRMTESLFERLGLRLDPEERVETLTLAQRQMLEIARAVSHNTDVLIMDEPTSALSVAEVRHLFTIIRDLRARGIGILYITHKLEEVFEIADEVTILRDGRRVGTHACSAISRAEIIRQMVGRDLTELFPKLAAPIGPVVLELRNLSLPGRFQDISFSLRAGEILGLAGLVGAGRSQLAETLFGLRPASAGEILIDGRPVAPRSPAEAMALGLGFLTEDRKDSGCFMALDCLANLQTAMITRGYARAGFVQQREITGLAEDMVARLRIKVPSLREKVENLSGGNQQKLMLARWLLTKPRILILDEPTRGIDVGAKAEIYRQISALAAEGVAVLMISSELPEILGMSDRIVVMQQGRVTGVLEGAESDQAKIMQLAAQ